MSYVQQVLGAFRDRPELYALAIAMVFSWGAALWAERMVFNLAMSKRALQRSSVLVTTVSCVVVGVILWPVFDPTEAPRVRFVGVLGVSLCSPFVYAGLTKWLGGRWPWLSSVFTNPLADATGTLKALRHDDEGPPTAPPAA